MEKVLAIDSNLVMFKNFINKDSTVFNDIKRILKHAITTQRPECETNYRLKQLVCYGFITYKDQIFIAKRLNKQSEKRLHDLYSIGIGGHANPIDMPIIDSLKENMIRELNEETYIKDYDINLYGFINDNSNDVGKVHLGVVYKINLLNPELSIKETDKMEGKFVPISNIHDYYKGMETWSQILIKNL